MEPKGPTTEATTGSEDVVSARPAVVEAVAVAVAVTQATTTIINEHRGIKRSRRDRGSSAKERISKMPACVPGKRSSIYRGVTRHRWTGRYEAHLWDKSTWNEAQNKKGKQVYLGAYDDEEAAARAYDLAALKYWGPGTLINFPVTDYARDVEEMQSVSREEYLASLRRKGSGFSRGAAKFKAMTRHPSLGRWEARLGQVLGNKYLYLGNPNSTVPQEEASFDMQALEYRGLNSASNVDLSRYISWLRPERAATQGTTTPAPAQAAPSKMKAEEEEGGASPTSWDDVPSLRDDQSQPEGSHQAWPGQASEPYQLPSLGVMQHSSLHKKSLPTPSALSLLLTSSIFKSMRERSSSHAPTTDNVDTKFDPGGAPLAHFLPGPSTSRLYDETSSQMFSPHVNEQYEIGFPGPSYGSSDRLDVHEGIEVPAVGSQGAPFSQSPAYWDPFVPPLTSQQLTSC